MCVPDDDEFGRDTKFSLGNWEVVADILTNCVDIILELSGARNDW